MSERIKALSREIGNDIISLRHELHKFPEGSHNETKTADILAEKFGKLPCILIKGVAGTGLVADLTVDGANRTVAIRADMDALPVSEANDVPYKSQNKGFMHACGHDAHMSIAYGAARILSHLQEELNVNVRVIFQPAEESSSIDSLLGNKLIGGAKPIIDKGYLDNVDYIIGLHVNPNLKAGYFGVKSGIFGAAKATFILELIGNSSHGSRPQAGKDAITCAAHMISALQTMISRETDPMIPIVLNILEIKSDEFRGEIIPSYVKMRGSIKVFADIDMEELGNKIREKARYITSAFGLDFRLNYAVGTPAIVNDPTVSACGKEAATKILGDNRVVEASLELGSDDVARYFKKTKGAYFLLGTGSDEYNQELHTSKFNLDDKLIPLASAIMA